MGTGALSVGLAKLGAQVFSTDCDEVTLANLRFNLEENEVDAEVLHWDWSEEAPQLSLSSLSCCVGCDLAYGMTSASLCQVLGKLKASAPALEAYLLLQERESRQVKAFEDAMGFQGWSFRRALCGRPGLDIYWEHELTAPA